MVAVHLSEQSYELVTELFHGSAMGLQGGARASGEGGGRVRRRERRGRGARRSEGAANAAERRLQRRQGT